MSNNTSGNQYLEATIQSASPAQLRLMLLERAAETAARLAASWKASETQGANEHAVKLLDLLTELLAGVQPGENRAEQEVCGKVSDLYVFLSQHLVAAEEHSDHTAIDEIKLVLEAEIETWRAVCAQASRGQCVAPAETGLNLQG